MSLGTTLLIFGGALFLFAFFLTRRLSNIRKTHGYTNDIGFEPEIPSHEHAVIQIEPGGRISFINQTAREQLKLWEQEPNLERLARRARPSQTFWSLCTCEGQAYLQIDGRDYNGVSYRLSGEYGKTILLTLQTIEKSSAISRVSENQKALIDFPPKLNLTMTVDLALAPTLNSILESVEQLIPSDDSKITIWDKEGHFFVPYHFVGVQGVDRHVDKTLDRYPRNGSFSGYIADTEEAVLISDFDSYPELSTTKDLKEDQYQSVIGVPLKVRQELIGTLEIRAREKNVFTEADVRAISALSEQAAVAIHNALIFQAEQKRAEELSGLANLARAVSSVRDDQELFAHLVQGITPLLDIEIAGFLIYDEVQRTLFAQDPFIGVPPLFVELYKVEIPIDSPAENIWQSQETIVTHLASEDPRFNDLKMDYSALAAGIRECVLVPLKSGGRSLGYLQAANKKNRMPFDQDDIRLLEIIALQAAPIIENANLIKQSLGRAFRAEALRRIASLTGSVATVDEIFKYSLLELARLLQADIAGIFLLDENLGELRVHLDSLFGVEPEQLPQILRIPIGDENFRFTVTASKRPFLSGNAKIDERVLPVFNALVEPLNILSVIDVPLVVRDQGLGEIILCSHGEDFFSQSDIQLTATVAGQLAIAFERSLLASQTNDELRQQVEHFTAITRITRELNSSSQLSYLKNLLLEEAIRLAKADTGKIFLFNLDESNGGKPSETEVPNLKTLSPLEMYVIETGSPLIIGDFDTPKKGFSPEIWSPPEEDIKSALIVPVAHQKKIFGQIALFGYKPFSFDNITLQNLRILSVQGAIAINNLQRYREQVEQSEKLNNYIDIFTNLIQSSEKLNTDQPLKSLLEEIAFSIQASTPFAQVIISELDPNDQNLYQRVILGLPSDLTEKSLDRPIPWHDIGELIKPEFSLGRAYFIPEVELHDSPENLQSFLQLMIAVPSPIVQAQDHLQSQIDPTQKSSGFLIIPLINASGLPKGLILLGKARENQRLQAEILKALDIFAIQTTIAIENYQQKASLTQKVYELSESILSHREAKAKLPALLQKEQEYLSELDSINRSTKHFEALRNIVDKINKIPDRKALLSTLGQEVINHTGFDLVLIAEPSEKGPQLISTLGPIPKSVNPEALLGQKNPLIQSLSKESSFLVPRIKEDQNWLDSPLLVSMGATGFICFPIFSGANIDSALLAIAQTELPLFNEIDENVFSLLAHQSGIAINNLNILSETGHRLLEVNLLLDFSRQLGSFEPKQILNTLIDSALQVAQAAQAGIVALFDDVSNALIPQTARGYINCEAMMEIVFDVENTLLGEVFMNGNAVIVQDVNYAEHYQLSSNDLLLYRDATGGALPVSCMVLPIQSGDKTLGVILLDNFRDIGAFTPDDQALITSLAQQTALNLENARLYQAAQNRANQLQALSEVASAITSSLEPEALIDSLLDKLKHIVPYETGTLWLREGNRLAIRAARGFENSENLIGLATTTEDSRLFSEMIETSLPISVRDVREDERFPEIGTERYAWLGVPLITKGFTIGLIALEKTEPGFYTVDYIQAANTFASQAAIALENARLFQESLYRTEELDQRSQRLALLNRFSNQISSVLDPNYILATTVKELNDAIETSIVSAVMWDSDHPVLRAEAPEMAAGFGEILPNAPIFTRLQQTLGVFNSQDISQEEELQPLDSFFEERQTKAIMILPLVTGELLHGFILVQDNREHHFSADDLELARIITNQAAVAVQNAMSFEATTRLTEELEQRVLERTAQLEEQHQRAQSLLRIMRELSASLDLDQVLNQTLAILNETVGAELSTILLINQQEKALYYRASVGYKHTLPKGGQLSSLKIDQGLAGWVLENRQSALVPDVNEDERWVPSADFPNVYKCVIVVPLRVGEEALGVVTLAHSRVNAFTGEDRELAQAAAMQMAVAINNAELFNLIRDQAEDLGTMLRVQRVEASRSMAILEAVANGVLVTDDHNKITLFNDAAEEILGLGRTEIIGKSLDTFIGLFGDAAFSWMETIKVWSKDPSSYQVGDTYEERISLDNNHIVSINLAPVVMGNEFLGTVSIFQDVTHQVEVDRLKSEFVATVSHELRTPMTSIKGYVDILLMGAAGNLTKQQLKFLEVVKTNTERLNILVNDLLDVSRIEAGKVELIIQPLDLLRIIQDVVNERKRQSEQENKRMTFHIELPESISSVPGDEERVRQIFDNLVSNAYLYTPEGGKIDIRIRQTEKEVQIDVKDNGIGINPEDFELIFERFYRGEHPLVLACRGNGLGLSIARQLVHMHQGRIWLTSEGIPGKGSTFSVALPL